MPIENDFLPFATGSGSNTLSQSAYAALPALSTGFQAGIANSAQLNTVWRKSSIIAAVLAQFIVDYSGQPAVDDGTTATLEANLLAAIQSIIAAHGFAPLAGPALTGTPTAPTQSATDNSTNLSTTAFAQTLIANLKSYVQTTYAAQSYVQQNFAPLASPGFSGAPTTPTPSGGAGDNSTHIPNTAWVQAYFATQAWVNANFATDSYVNGTFQPNLGFTPVQQGGGANQGSNKIHLGFDGTGLRLQVDASDLGEIALVNTFSASFAGNGYQRLPGGMLLQWGTVQITSPGQVFAFPVSFPTGLLSIVGVDQGNSSTGTSTVNVVTVQPILGDTSHAKGFGYNAGQVATTNICWMAIGH